MSWAHAFVWHHHQGFKSPVYFSVATHSPANPFPLPADGETSPSYMRYPGHQWDMIAATQAWAQFADAPTGVPAYTPEPSDVGWGGMLLREWLDFVANGQITPGGLPSMNSSFDTVDTAAGFPDSYNVVVQSTSAVSNMPNMNAYRCKALGSPPLSLDQRYWSTN